jgi:hypothetical protein
MAHRSTLTILAALMISTMTPTVAAARYYNPDAAECHRLAKTAASVGWPRRELPELRRIAGRESLCRNLAYNPRDPHGGSYCAMQINGSNRGYLIRERIIRSDMEELRASPTKCLKAALALWKLYGWRPWAGASSAP